MQLEGLPEGVEAVAYRVPNDDDFWIHGDHIYRGPDGSPPGGVLVVNPASSYGFERSPSRGYFHVYRELDPPEVITARFTVKTETERRILLDELKKSDYAVEVVESQSVYEQDLAREVIQMIRSIDFDFVYKEFEYDGRRISTVDVDATKDKICRLVEISAARVVRDLKSEEAVAT